MKKKILIFITIFMLILNINYEVKADGEAPSSAGYKVVVKNKKGTSLYADGKKVTTIPYKGVAYVVYEGYDDNNKKILYVTYKTYDAGWNSYYVKAEDVLPKDYNLKDANKLEEPQEAIILNKNGGILREGPSEVYEKLSKTIPTGTTITYQYIDNGYGLWAYVEYEDIKGWLYTHSYANDSSLEPGYVVDKRESYIELLTIGKNAKLYSTIYTKKNEIIETISINTKLDCKYEYVSSCYVKYNGHFGWVNFDENFVYRDDYNNKDKLLIIYDTPLYKDSNFKNKHSITISSNTFLSDFYHKEYGDEPGFMAPYYLKYKNQYGWLKEDDVAYCYDSDLNESKIINKELSIYNKPDANSKIILTIPNGVTIKTHCEKMIYGENEDTSWIFVEYDDITGWVMGDSLYDIDDEIIDDESTEKPNEEPKKNNTTWLNTLTPVQFALICIGAASVLAVTAIVIILLIKKNDVKNSKNDKKQANKAQKEEIKNKENNENKNESFEKEIEPKKSDENIKNDKKEESIEDQIPKNK